MNLLIERLNALGESVMLALRGDAESYASALLEVARLALPRPLATLGLVGILESRGSLRQRIERLMESRSPRRAGVTLVSILCAVGFGAVALPMGPAPTEFAETNGASVQPGPVPTPPSDPGGKQTEAGVLVRDGKVLYEMGRMDDAEKKFSQALQRNPREQAAYYYLYLIKEARSKQQGRGLRKTTPGRQRLLSTLQGIRLDSVAFDSLPLGEVIGLLSQESKKRDPEGKGINFLMNQQSPEIAPGVNPATGLPGPRPAEPVDIQAIPITINPALSDVRLLDVLDAVVKAAGGRIKCSIEDYAVVFSTRDPNETPPLYTRSFKMDPNTLESAVRSVMGKSESGDGQATAKALREFLASLGVDLAPPKTFFYSQGEGTLLVRATLQDLDIIEAAIQVMNIAPAPLRIEARFIEVSEEEEASFWEKHPGAKQSPLDARTVQLTGEEAHRQLDEWKAKRSAEVLSQQTITTLSGRQARVQVLDTTSVVTFTNSPGGELETNQVALGPTLDVLPTLSADGLRLDLAITASFNEFLGYEALNDGHPPLPHFRVRQMSVVSTVWDGHTLVIGGAVVDQNRPGEKPGEKNKRLLVMVNPAVVDPAGNRIHSDTQVEGARSRNGVLTAPR